MKGNIAIIAALSGELKPLVTHRTARSWKRVASAAGTEVWEYRHKEGCWLAACAGMGGGRATVALAEAEKRMRLDAVCSAGWAGALNDRLAVEAMCSPALIVDRVTGERYRPARWEAEWPILVSTAKVADAAEKQKLAEGYYAGLVDMEAATLARLALGKRVPFYCFKAISDGATARLPDLNPYIDQRGQMMMAPFLLHVGAHPSTWGDVMRLGRHSSAAAKNLAEAIYDWLDERAYIRQANGDTPVKRDN